MTLASNVTARYATQLLVNLTNPNDSTATTINTTKLGNATTDVEAEFATIVGVAYDDSVATHVAAAGIGVIGRLQEWTGHASAAETISRYLARLNSLALVTGRDRILPQSEGVLVPSEPDPAVTVRPPFDDDVWEGIIPGEPG